jgi:hypothetical protein
MRLIDLTGQRFGKLVVLERDGSDNFNKPTWLCQCDCGSIKVIKGLNLRHGDTRSCGCLVSERLINDTTMHGRTTHGLSHDPLYKLWNAIAQRTTNPNGTRYSCYGGRGIKMHPKWLEDAESFIKYIRMALGPKPTPQHSIDRIDNDEGYVPGNLRWATASQQNQNKRPRTQYTRSQNGRFCRN